MIKSRLEQLRALMKEHNMDAYIIPTSDFHESEYVGTYFKSRAYMSGFTGSAGTLLVTQEEAGLWTDARYFIQAANELKDTSINLFKIGEEGVLTIYEYLNKVMPNNGVLGFDGRTLNASFGLNLISKLSSKNITASYASDLIDKIWDNRPSMSKEPAFLLSTSFAGETSTSKLAKVRESLKTQGADTLVLTTLDDIAWLYNIRGNDIEYNPVVLSYSVVTLDQAYLFVEETKINDEIKASLRLDQVTILPYNDIYDFVKEFNKKDSVMLDLKKVNYAIYSNLSDEVNVIKSSSPTMYMKAIKNEVELESSRNSHIKDGVAFTKFMYWLKTNVGKIPMDEISVSDYLEEQRKKQDGFIELSFNTICGYKENGAIIHYSATEESKATLQAEGLLLVDSGGQYFDGTTDITRTMALGPVDDIQKFHFTTVLRSMLNLSSAKFLHGCVGLNLDILARGPLWELDLDYKCGTGHGIGFLLNVHEAPNGFRWKVVPERNDGAVFEEGMITTNEPGVYIEGSHGIRLENELVCRKGQKNEYGQFMYFETITFAPIDLDCIDSKYLNETDRTRLNTYHKEVFEKISPFLTEEEVEWLKVYTREI